MQKVSFHLAQIGGPLKSAALFDRTPRTFLRPTLAESAPAFFAERIINLWNAISATAADFKSLKILRNVSNVMILLFKTF